MSTTDSPSIPIPSQDDHTPVADYTSLSSSDLISRNHNLETQLREQTALLSRLTSAPSTTSSQRPSTPARPRRYDASFSTRHIALKLSYIGTRYNGYEHANGTVPPKPTVEEVLWKALRKARFISPPLEEGADESFDVVWGAKERADRYMQKTNGGSTEESGKKRLDLVWDGCQYSKCGRTDRGVSAFGQVIGIRVRTKRPDLTLVNGGESGTRTPLDTSVADSVQADGNALDDEMPGIGADELASSAYTPSFDPVRDELPYISILNNILPPDIRVLAWCPDPPPDFDARFSCRERRYKYFFTNPAFLPMPGPLGMMKQDSNPARLRHGWLDIEQMKKAAKKLEGLHDFRNLCKIDPSKQMISCLRRITFADVEEFDSVGEAFQDEPELSSGRAATNGILSSMLSQSMKTAGPGPKVYTFSVYGSAFLWHQVRCMVAILFLVGQGLEQPGIVDELLDVDRNPCKPGYELAEDAPLVLWDCIFPTDDSNNEDRLKWVYAGDALDIATQNSFNDNKFGTGGLLDGLWSEWRQAKIKEVLAGSMLDLALKQGDGTALQRGGVRDLKAALPRSQLIFKGGDRARPNGHYTPVMKKLLGDSLEVQNEKYIARKKARRNAKEVKEESGEDE